MTRAVVAGTLIALAAAGCGGGGDATPAAGRSDRLVDFSRKPPYVNSLERDTMTGDLLLTTNRGFFRLEGDRAVRQRASISVRGKRASLGTFLELDASAGGGALVGSGHPDPGSKLPQYLGYLRSADGGRTWSSVSRLGTADLHKIVFQHGRVYAWDAVLSAIVISDDDGRTFSEHFTPRGLIVDFAVDPSDPDRLLAATDEQVYRSEDSGDSWRPALLEKGARLAWPEAETLYLATEDGTVQRSSDGAETFEDVGRVEGEPAVLKPEGDVLLMALSDGSVVRSADGGETWADVFRP